VHPSVHFCIQNTNKKTSCKSNKSEISELQNPNEPSSDELLCPEKLPTPRGPKQHSQTDCTGISTHLNWAKLLLVEKAISILQDRVNCKLRTRSEVTQDTYINSVLFCFTKGLDSRNITHEGTARFSTCTLFSTGLMSIIYTVTQSYCN
jgi:hypothetical protein